MQSQPPFYSQRKYTDNNCPGNVIQLINLSYVFFVVLFHDFYTHTNTRSSKNTLNSPFCVCVHIKRNECNLWVWNCHNLWNLVSAQYSHRCHRVSAEWGYANNRRLGLIRCCVSDKTVAAQTNLHIHIPHISLCLSLHTRRGHTLVTEADRSASTTQTARHGTARLTNSLSTPTGAVFSVME